MSKHWGKWCLFLGAGWLLAAGGGCGSGEYEKRLQERMKQLRQSSPFDEVLYDAVALGDTPVLVRVPKMCGRAWVENSEAKGSDGKAAGPPRAVDPGRVRPMLDDQPPDKAGDPPVRDYIELPGWTLVAYEAMETVEEAKSLPEKAKVGCYWYFAVREKEKAKGADPINAAERKMRSEKYKQHSSRSKDGAIFTNPQDEPVKWKERLLLRGPMRFYYENDEGNASADPFCTLPGTLELCFREEGNHQILFGWRAPTEVAERMDLAKVAEKVGGTIVLSESGGAPKAKSPPPKPPEPVAKPETPEGEKPEGEKPEGEKLETKPGDVAPKQKPEPTPEPTDPAGQRALAMARMKQIGAAVQQYAKQKGRFPPATFAPQGQAHSWRVAILPHLGTAEAALYKQFRLSEAWDSGHNLKVAEQMPEVFKTPGGPPAPSTCYLAPLGIKTVFGPMGQREALASTAVQDGSANTLLVVEANADRAVPWNAPQDFEVNEPAPALGLGTLRDGRFLGVTADGTVRPIHAQLDPATLNALFTATGGEQIDLQRLETPAPVVPAEKSLLDLAKAAFAEGRERDGLKYLMAEAVATGNEEVLGTFRRCSALKRTGLLLRWGILVEIAPPAAKPGTGKPGTEPIVPPGVPRPGVPPKPGEAEAKPEEIVRFWHESLVPPLRTALRERVGKGQFGPWLKDVPSGEPKAGEALQRWPGIVVLTETDGPKARAAALAEGLDVALVVEVTVLAGRGDQARTVAELAIRDLAAEGELGRVKRKLNKMLADPKKKEGAKLIDDAVADAMQAIDETIRLEELPEISAVQAKARADSLVAKHKPEDPLPALMELRFYASKKLLTDDQLKEYYGKLLANTDDGAKLAAGNPAERRAVVNRLLPSPK